MVDYKLLSILKKNSISHVSNIGNTYIRIVPIICNFFFNFLKFIQTSQIF